MKFGIGQPLRRLEDNKFLTGNGSYTDDLNFNDQVFMYILRSPHASAKITSISYQKAKEYKGVLTIITHQEIKKMNINPMYPGFKVKNKDGSAMADTFRNILSDGRVRYVGEPVLAIIAETAEIAQEAADFVDIEFEELRSTSNLNIAIKPDAPVVREELANNICFDWELGDPINTKKSF